MKGLLKLLPLWFFTIELKNSTVVDIDKPQVIPDATIYPSTGIYNGIYPIMGKKELTDPNNIGGIEIKQLFYKVGDKAWVAVEANDTRIKLNMFRVALGVAGVALAIWGFVAGIKNLFGKKK